MKRELIKSIDITDSSLGEEEIEEKLEQGDLTALPTSILQVCCQIVDWLVAFRCERSWSLVKGRLLEQMNLTLGATGPPFFCSGW